ncbi:Transcriptional regulator, contains XRE-family HTH domain [Actinomadura meyerae]|uniref:Transcriptional regulator, contains XRE-family HTH domain n=1 Tax=Actinomadura meyerae TaxID=240840 RepID=A0A239C6I2_9ACTN|nr:helix-turn-helix transcriptional regulator [Actinomadura meyerae]SNS15720.1 Transcriptional regulator, contains XRE-family HTH domain [Actinomadura meyerae]
MLDDLAGRRTGERIRILRERKGLTRPTLAGLVGRSASWLKGIETGRRLPPRLPTLVRLAEALGTGDVALLAGTDMDLGDAAAIPVASFSRIPLAAIPPIREAVRDPLLAVPETRVDVPGLAARVSQAWRLWHGSPTHRTDVGRVLPALVRDARATARTAEGDDRRAANAVLADLYALVQHELVWAAEPELIWVVADRGVAAAHTADRPVALAGAAWTQAIVQRSAGDVEGALTLVNEAAALLEPRLEGGPVELQAMYGALLLHAATSNARDGREGEALRHLDEAQAVAERLPPGYHHPWTQFGSSNVAVHAVSVRADLSKSAAARDHARQIDPDTVPSRERRARLMVETARTYHRRRDYSAALDWLERAYPVCNDSVHYSPQARQMAADAVDHGGPMIDRRARTFARLLGLPA